MGDILILILIIVALEGLHFLIGRGRTHYRYRGRHSSRASRPRSSSRGKMRRSKGRGFRR